VFTGGKKFYQNQKWPLWARCEWLLLFFFRDRTSKKKKARGAFIYPRLVDLREIKTFLKQRGTPGEAES